MGVERFVFASTCSNYGQASTGDDVATEEWELTPVSLYAETKVAAELDVLARSANGFATTCLRFATVYGASPRMRFDLTVNEFTRDVVLGRPLVVYGEQFWRPYVHVATRRARSSPSLDAPVELRARRGLQRRRHERELPQARPRRASARSASRRRTSRSSTGTRIPATTA